MNQETRVAELLVRWLECRHRGEAASLEGLCADCPELVGPLQEQIDLYSELESFLGENTGAGLENTVGPGLDSAG
jgi:hypothetical protein